jgi:hypothetical protein
MISKSQFDEEVHNIVGQLIRPYKPEEFEKRLNLDDPFIKNTLREGKLLYEAA